MPFILSVTSWMSIRTRQAFLPALVVLAAASLPAHADEAPTSPPAPPPEAAPQWEGAIGLRTSYAPTYQGASGFKAKLTPGFFLRYGRFTITNSSGFVTRRADDVVRGLGVDLSPSQRFRMNLALRFDQGRKEATDAALTGLGDIKPTIRARLNATYLLEDGWRLGASWSVDALGRGGGNMGDVGFSRELRLTPATVWTFGSALSMAGDRYLQTWYGVNAQQAAATGYPVYEPGAGLRDVAVFTGFRTDLSERWLLLGGAGANRLLGPAADSPLTKDRNGWSANIGLAWRF